MSSSSNSNKGEDDDQEMKKTRERSKTLKEGERILAPTRRPDGTLRKPVRIRPGYTPQEEVAIYQPKPALLRKEMTSHIGPPGYDPDLDSKPKSKSVKRNERKKERRLQAANEKEISLEPTVVEDSRRQEAVVVENSVHSLTSQVNELTVSGGSSAVAPTADSVEASDPIGMRQDIDKKIRALKKKIRLTETLQEKTAAQDLKPEQLEKLSKLEDWRKELKQLEDKKAETLAA